jgi:hypothetical protein
MAKRTDQNQADIIAALRAVGASVQDLHLVGRDCPDIIVGYQGQNYLMEVKSNIGHLSEGQRRWHADWRGRVWVVRCVDDALGVIGGIET